MKKILENCLWGGVLLFSLSMSLTSCEDILGEWSRPTPNPVTPGGGSTINATAIALDQTMKVIKLGGDALTITATVMPTDATDKTVTWESKDPTIATVENGVVTPVGVGITTITAKSGELSATCEVFVGNEVNISSITYEAKNYDILKGNMGANQLTIPNDIKVVFNGVQTTQQIFCLGDATIILADDSENTVTVPTSYKQAGIKIGDTGTTLTINGETAGTGRLNATGGNYGAGIGTDFAHNNELSGGNIVINGGTVTAQGGNYGAGIGTGRADGEMSTASITCGDIMINGGTVTATCGEKAAGIGTGGSVKDMGTASNECGAITIGTGVTSVTATKGSESPNSIGEGYKNGGTQKCGTITFGTASVFNGSAWSPSDPLTAGTYGGLKLVISEKNVADDTWTLTPAE